MPFGRCGRKAPADIPLGIELAAARLRALSVTELADRLDESFHVLARASKSTVARQRTLGNAVALLYDLLNDAEQAQFRRLSVFVDGFDAAASRSDWAGPSSAGWPGEGPG